MRAIVTGGAGFIGTNLIKKLLEDGTNISENYHRNKIVSLDNYSTGTKENEQSGCVYFDADISKIPDFDFFMSKPDVIFHLAARARISPSFDYPVDYFDTNAKGTLNLLEWIRKMKSKGHSCKIVYAGSSSVHYGIHKNMYTFSKYVGGDLMRLYSEMYRIETSICHFYNVYGEHMIIDGPFAPAIGIFQSQYLQDKPITITGDGEQRRDFTYVGDIVDGLLKAKSEIFYGDSFELGRGKNYSMNEVANMFGKEYPKVYIPAREGEAQLTSRHNDSAIERLRWNPQMNLSDWIDDWKNKNE